VTTQNAEPENNDVNVTVVEESFAPEDTATSEETVVATPAQEAQIQETETQTVEEQVEEQSVRAFTDFIEEFRQTESFGPLLQDAQAEPFSSLNAGEEQDGNQFITGWENTPFAESAILEETPFADGVLDAPASEELSASPESSGNAVQEISEPTQVAEDGQLPTLAEQQPPTSGAEPAVTTERPVSPLLRPASRNRLPRHGNLRQRDEMLVETVPTTGTVNPEASLVPSVEETAQVQAAPVEEQATVEPTPAEEQPRPARRYRFDRRPPALSGIPATPVPVAPVQAPTEESQDSHAPAQVFARTDKGQERDVQAAQQSTSVAQPTEQPAPKQAVAQEPVEAPEARGTKVASSKNGRRRHGQAQQGRKEQAAPVAPVESTAEVTAAATEASEPQVPEVAPEDLPPLEYSELQAASSRRRRRRRSGSASTPAATKAVTPNLPAALPADSASPPANVPHNIVVPGAATQVTSQHSIVSGYTVSQMNHGNDGTGPFMGPDPSPARGSNLTRPARPIRNEAQRIPSYPTRQNEIPASSASINHLANVVAQAIEAQSDRLLAELRHANQAPTNISVSLPQFPSTERVGVFVDVANLLYSARTLRMTIDFGKLLDFLRGNRRLVRAQAYCPTSPQPGDEQMFLQAVKGLGYRITTKDYKTFSSGAKKADLDLDLCMDVVRLVEGKAVDCIVLVSGDGDFIPMLDYCSDHGVRVEVAAFDESLSGILRQSCDLFINLSMLDTIRA